jgi:hypothetical protein
MRRDARWKDGERRHCGGGGEALESLKHFELVGWWREVGVEREMKIEL